MPFLDTPQALADFCAAAREAGRFALDMEFERERTYRATLQLIQVCVDERESLVDPLAVEDLEPLWDLIEDPEVQVLVHAGSQDMEIFHDHAQRVPRNVFDTQVAAALVGLGEQPGYADLVRRLLDVRLKKGERTTDWGRRPLTDAQMEYALDDVRYLHAVHARLEEMLADLGRRAWLDEELAQYAEESTYVKDPRMLWMRVSRHRSLDPRGLAILRELAQWREETAARRNIPRNRVVQDDVMIDICRRRPRKQEQLSALRRLHPKEAERSGPALLDCVARGLEVPDEELPRLPVIRMEDPQQELCADLLAVYLKYRSKKLKIAPSYLATRKDLSRLVAATSAGDAGPGQLPILTGWRHELIGHELVEFLAGQTTLAVRPQKLRLTILKPGDQLPVS